MNNVDPENSFSKLKEDMEKKWFADCRNKVVIKSYYEFIQEFINDYCEALKKSSGPGKSRSQEEFKRIKNLLSKHSTQPEDLRSQDLDYFSEINEVLTIIFRELNKKAENLKIKKKLIVIDELMREANGKSLDEQLNFEQWAKLKNIDFIFSFRPSALIASEREIEIFADGKRIEPKIEENQHFQTLTEIHRNRENILRFLDWYQASEIYSTPRKLGSSKHLEISNTNLERPLPKGDEKKKYPRGMVHWIPIPDGKEGLTSEEIGPNQSKLTSKLLEKCLLDIRNGADADFTLIKDSSHYERLIMSDIRKLPNIKGENDLTSFEGSEDDVIVYFGHLHNLTQTVISRARNQLILVTPPLESLMSLVFEKRCIDQLEEECRTQKFVRKVTLN